MTKTLAELMEEAERSLKEGDEMLARSAIELEEADRELAEIGARFEARLKDVADAEQEAADQITAAAEEYVKGMEGME